MMRTLGIWFILTAASCSWFFFVMGCDRSPSGPTVEMAAAEIDLGRVPEGVSKDFEVRLFNRGKKPLAILGVDASCGCTQVKCLVRELAPGHHSKIVGTINTTGSTGSRNVTIVVRTNDSEKPAIKLRVSYFSISTLDADQAFINAGEINQGRGFDRTLVLWASPNVQLRGVSASKGLAFEWKAAAATGRAKIGQGTHLGSVERKLLIRGLANLPLGKFNGYVNIIGNCGKTSVDLQVPVIATVVGDIGVVPKRLVIAKGISANGRWNANIQIFSKSSRQFEINSVYVIGNERNDRSVEAGVAKNSKGYVVRLDGQLRSSDESVGGAVIIVTNLPDEREIHVPLVIWR